MPKHLAPFVSILGVLSACSVQSDLTLPNTPSDNLPPPDLPVHTVYTLTSLEPICGRRSATG